MGEIAEFQAKKLIIGVLETRECTVADIYDVLEGYFGPIDFQSKNLKFSFTTYYEKEMGEKLERVFISFKRLVDPETLADIKIKTNEIEDIYSVDSKRRINLDPGLLDASRLILATTKDNAHRIPLRNGIYGEVTLTYSKKDFHHLPWTYPDYRSMEYKEILQQIRTLFCAHLKQGK